MHSNGYIIKLKFKALADFFEQASVAIGSKLQKLFASKSASGNCTYGLL
jgi:hypothetical protein